MKRLKNHAFLSKRGDHHVERTGVLAIPFGVSRLKTSSAGAFFVPFRALSRRTLTGDNVLILDLVLLEGKKIFRATPTKWDLGTF